jgi:thiol-disulfide isomerase/thioredoxin
MVPILTRFALVQFALGRFVRLSAFVAIGLWGATAGAAEPPKFAGISGDFSPIDPPEQISTPNFQDKLGQPVNLDSFKGKVVVLNFWATWCEPCRAEMPSMQKLADKFGPDKLVVLGVNYQEGEPRIRRFLTQNPVQFTILMDREGSATKAWITRVFPTSIIIGPDGRPRHLVVGEYDWASPAIDQLVTKLLPTQPKVAANTQNRPFLAASGAQAQLLSFQVP